MKKLLLASFALAATLPAAASASVAIQQANAHIQEPLMVSAPASHSVKADVDAGNMLGHSAAMTETELALMAHTRETTDLPGTDHRLDTPKQPADW